MKRFHIHKDVDDLTQSVAFYSQLFACEPARVVVDDAKRMLDDLKSRAECADMRLRDGAPPQPCALAAEYFQS